MSRIYKEALQLYTSYQRANFTIHTFIQLNAIHYASKRNRWTALQTIGINQEKLFLILFLCAAVATQPHQHQLRCHCRFRRWCSEGKTIDRFALTFVILFWIWSAETIESVYLNTKPVSGFTKCNCAGLNSDDIDHNKRYSDYNKNNKNIFGS